MKDRLSAVAEETLLTLAPLDLEGNDDARDDRRLIVLASSDGPVADLEFIGGGNEANIEDQVRQLQQHDSETPVEHEISLLLLRSYASSVRHRQYHDTHYSIDTKSYGIRGRWNCLHRRLSRAEPLGKSGTFKVANANFWRSKPRGH